MVNKAIIKVETIAGKTFDNTALDDIVFAGESIHQNLHLGKSSSNEPSITISSNLVAFWRNVDVSGTMKASAFEKMDGTPLFDDTTSNVAHGTSNYTFNVIEPLLEDDQQRCGRCLTTQRRSRDGWS
jgi:hypothetical protein